MLFIKKIYGIFGRQSDIYGHFGQDDISGLWNFILYKKMFFKRNQSEIEILPINCGCLLSHSQSSPMSLIPVYRTAMWTCSGSAKIAWTTWVTLNSSLLLN